MLKNSLKSLFLTAILISIVPTQSKANDGLNILLGAIGVITLGNIISNSNDRHYYNNEVVYREPYREPVIVDNRYNSYSYYPNYQTRQINIVHTYPTYNNYRPNYYHQRHNSGYNRGYHRHYR